LIVLGGGPIGAELAQAYRRLGAKVTILDIGPLLPRDDPELVAVVRRSLEADGVQILDRVEVSGVEAGPVVTIRAHGEERRIEGSHLLVATGRKPNIEALDLDAAGIAHDQRGIRVNDGLKTSNPKVYAIGDVAGGLQFTHLASYHAGLVIRNALFRLPVKAKTDTVPRVTYTDPELASVGLSKAEAQERGIAHEVVRWPFAENDRARTERATAGLVELVVGKKGRVLGAAIVGAHAGELILPWVMAVATNAKVSTMAGLIAPYPTLGEAGKRAAGAYFTPRLFSSRTRKLVRFLRWFG
jgi:pyruvate/2-oxoglutarate dehydrogenase complex dihydrolipoamide dehydrogenase (E3) component